MQVTRVAHEDSLAYTRLQLHRCVQGKRFWCVDVSLTSATLESSHMCEV